MTDPRWHDWCVCEAWWPGEDPPGYLEPADVPLRTGGIPAIERFEVIVNEYELRHYEEEFELLEAELTQLLAERSLEWNVLDVYRSGTKKEQAATSREHGARLPALARAFILAERKLLDIKRESVSRQGPDDAQPITPASVLAAVKELVPRMRDLGIRELFAIEMDPTVYNVFQALQHHSGRVIFSEFLEDGETVSAGARRDASTGRLAGAIWPDLPRCRGDRSFNRLVKAGEIGTTHLRYCVPTDFTREQYDTYHTLRRDGAEWEQGLHLARLLNSDPSGEAEHPDPQG